MKPDNIHLMLDPEGNSFVFLRVLMFPETKSRETSGLMGKTKLFPEGPDIKCFVIIISRLLLQRQQKNNQSESKQLTQVLGL